MSTAMVPAQSPMTADELREALPDKVKKSVNQALINQINQVMSEPEFYESYRDNLIGYTSVMQDGKFKIEQYLAAVKYVSHKLLGRTNIDAYSRTFPDKIARFTAEGVVPKDIASYVTAYNKSKLVNLIFAQTMVPFYVLNQDMYQKALNTQADLMVTSNSDLVRTQAANSILQHLKPPETARIELDVTVKQGSHIDALREATEKLVEAERRAIVSGSRTPAEVAAGRVVIDNATGDVE